MSDTCTTSRRATPMRTAALLTALAIGGTIVSAAASAQPQPPPQPAPRVATAMLPEWDRLSAEQRALLIAPMRQRWNDSADRRSDIYQHAQRWESMTPEQRKSARNGKKRFDRMDPAQREEARALFDRMQGLPPDQRKALRNKWKAMTPEQRHEWVQQNGASSR